MPLKSSCFTFVRKQLRKNHINPAHSHEWISKNGIVISNHLMFNNDLCMLLFPLHAYILIKLQISGFYIKLNVICCTEIFRFIISWKDFLKLGMISSKMYTTQFFHGTKIETEITCKKIPWHKRESACRWLIVKKS